mmetsp:Transcript_35791/g.57677  ORF Transcript_35791/g.57677 Transcript_35791/m.57677 type:complete len:110 (-) Transcript_35791:1540-1869(-)
MTSEFWTVLRRCAMLTMPRPPARAWLTWSSVSWIIFSEALSRALVASSKKRNEAFLMSARAMAIRCFWPPENCEPPDPTKVSNLFGSESTNVSCASLQTCCKSFSVADG